jgi:tetratricopeptide (TPR) repeat protein
VKPSDYTIYNIIKFAEDALRIGNYEDAARFFQYLMTYFGAINDESNKRIFAIKTGECCMQAAEKARGSPRAIILSVRAAEAFQEGGDFEMARLCSSKIWEYYIAINEEESRKDSESIHALKVFGDHLASNGELEKAANIYSHAAENASKGGRTLLAGGLCRDAGDCYRKIGNLKYAADYYTKAADAYLQCREYFEASLNYCKVSLIFICLGRMREALHAAEKAESACYWGEIGIFLKDLSRICKLLSQGSLSEAEENWNKIKAKFSGEYARLVESSFQAARKIN